MLSKRVKQRGCRLAKNRNGGIDGSDLVEPALFHRRRSIEILMPLAVRITARLKIRLMWVVVSSSDLRTTCLVPIKRRDEAKENGRHAAKQ